MNEYYIKGLEHCKNEQFEEAISEFNRSLLLNPAHMECFYNRGMAKFRLERYLDAIQDFDEALDLNPNNADILSQRGVTKHLMGNSEAGLKDLDQAQVLEPTNAYRYSSRAFIRAKVGDVFGAQDDYKKALELDPEDAIAWNNLGLLEDAIGYKQSAQERFKKADGIADEGQTFEKPDLDEIIKANKENNTPRPKVSVTPSTEKTLARDKSPNQSIKTQQDEIKSTSTTPPLSTKEYIRVVKDVFTSKAVFKDFIQFVKGKFLLKKDQK
ncbi:MAG: tetratricopeptide repeat protein [Flammeovirgaceae bacterium]